MDANVGNPSRTIPPFARALLVLFLLYAFLVGVGLLEAGIAALGKGFQQGLLESVSNPISGLCAGLLATVLVQSSSVSTSTIVGLVGTGTLPLGLAVPMVMGANIGTTVTSTLAALGSIRRADEFQRAFAAATVHDFFNLLAVAVLLPLEIATGFLQRMAAALTGVALDAGLRASEPGKSPIRAAVKLPVQWVEGLMPGGGLTAVILLVVGLAVIFLALGLITRNMRRLVAGSVERVMNRVVGKGGGLVGILAGIGVTVAVQSSSITTSILVPLVGAGVLTLASAYPITLGANVGTTITALLASLAVVRPEGLTIALVHLLFNVVGILILYPVPKVRMVPIRLAEGLADAAVRRTRVVIAYVVTVFLVLPLLGVFLIQ
ncbi:MAG TPA: Na/Pi symporter [Longimicrobium sp.]|nr:Na/Pi symporter [Longimicrobium sp.]